VSYDLNVVGFIAVRHRWLHCDTCPSIECICINLRSMPESSFVLAVTLSWMIGSTCWKSGRGKQPRIVVKGDAIRGEGASMECIKTVYKRRAAHIQPPQFLQPRTEVSSLTYYQSHTHTCKSSARCFFLKTTSMLVLCIKHQVATVILQLGTSLALPRFRLKRLASGLPPVNKTTIVIATVMIATMTRLRIVHPWLKCSKICVR